MAKLSSKKRKNSSFLKKKSLVGLAPDVKIKGQTNMPTRLNPKLLKPIAEFLVHQLYSQFPLNTFRIPLDIYHFHLTPLFNNNNNRFVLFCLFPFPREIFCIFTAEIKREPEQIWQLSQTKTWMSFLLSQSFAKKERDITIA